MNAPPHASRVTDHVFHSVHHPGEVPFALVLARAQAQPVALALLGVFVVTMGAVLQGEEVLGTLLWAAPLAYAAAAAWSVYRLHSTPAALVLRSGFGAVLSVWDVARSREVAGQRFPLQPVFPPFRKEGQMHVGIGDAVHTLHREAWPRYKDLLDALNAAAAALHVPTV